MQVKDILRTNYLAVTQDDTLSSVFGQFGRGKHTEAVVIDDKKTLVGMLDKRSLIRSRIDLSSTKVRKFVAKTATLTEDMELERAAELMFDSDFHVLPVIDQNRKLLGIAGARDVLEALQDKLTQRASELGTMKLMTLKDSDPIGKAIALLYQKKIDHIPLVDETGKLAGITSLVDIFRFHMASPQGSNPGRGGKHGRTSKSGQDSGERSSYDSMPLQNIMTRAVVTASPDTKGMQIVKLLKEGQVSDIVLVKDDVPVGIVTSKDLLREVARA
jgi:CBS domain-containing protein